MNPTQLSDRLHAADGIEVDHVDAIIAGAIRQGQQRRRVRQRMVPAVIAVIALATTLGLAGILAVRDSRTADPAATTTSPTAGPIPPAKPGVTSAQVLDLVTGYLPEGMSVETRAAPPSTTRGGVSMTLEDADGPAQAEAGILRPTYEPGAGCTRQGHCRRVRAGGKTFYEYTDWKTREGFRRYDVATYYHRPDGLVTRVMQHNFVDDRGPVTRPTPRGLDGDEGWPVTGETLPLTQAEVLALLTAPEWEALAARCRPDPTIGGC